jgi:two-component system, OmpR family, alkaline phosphatase synthesis response regulator PhoP
MSARILLVEDEPGLVLTLTDMLTAEGYAVESAGDGPTGLAKALDGGFDLMILDVMLPGMNGMDVCRELRRRNSDLAVLMLTARAQLMDRIGGLKVGADDYLTKPFDSPELLARIEALLRRVRRETAAAAAPVRFGDIELDSGCNEVRRGGRTISLAGKEMELLRYLIERRGKTVSRDALLEGVWDYQPGVTSRTVDVHIAWLRQKLEDNPQAPRYIHTVRGVGYRFSG